MPSFLFVYGTLNPKIAPPEIRRVVQRMRPVGKALATGTLFDLGEYPGAIFHADDLTTVQGMVYRLPLRRRQAFLRQLDDYEGVNPHEPAAGLYLRKAISVTRKNGRKLRCWAYEYLGDSRSARLIEDGIFTKRKP
jgi:gamma-glutamylcyclotransferase (GGCT)/AIG2-like uncharacterized protein YtfP